MRLFQVYFDCNNTDSCEHRCIVLANDVSEVAGKILDEFGGLITDKDKITYIDQLETEVVLI